MEWYWWLVIGIAAALALVGLVAIAFVGPKWLKDIVLDLVKKAEAAVGSGNGEIKFDLVLKGIETLTHGWVPEHVLKSIIEWAVKQLKAKLEEDPASVAKRVSEVREAKK